MKPSHYLLLILILIKSIVTAQSYGTKINYITDKNLLAVKFFDSNTGIAVGDSGTILLTKNSGVSWNKINSNTKYTLRAVSLIGNSMGFIVGGDYSQTLQKYVGVVLKSTDKGETWKIIREGNNDLYHTVFFTSENIGYVGGTGTSLSSLDYNPALKRTTDSGMSWQSCNYPADLNASPIYSIKFVNSNVGYACGAGISLKTTDAGLNWFNQTSSSFNAQYFYDQHFFDEANGFQFGQNVIRTIDGGKSWVFKNPNPSWLYFRSVKFVNEKEAIAVGFNGFFSKSTDGGENWLNYSLGFETELLGVDISSNKQGVAVGRSGILVSFNLDSLTTNTTIKNICFLSPAATQIVYNNSELAIKLKAFNVFFNEWQMEYSLDDGQTWSFIIKQSYMLDFTYIWNTAGIDTSSNARLKFIDWATGESYISNPFKVKPIDKRIWFTYPNKKIYTRVNSNIEINWDFDYTSFSNVGFQFIPNSYETYPAIPINSKSTKIKLPGFDGNFQLKIFDLTNPQIFTISDTIVIKSNPGFFFTKPTEGNILQSDSIRTIEFASYYNERIKIEYTSDLGSTWNIIETNIKADSNKAVEFRYSWKVPKANSKRCRIKLSGFDNPNSFKVSPTFEMTEKETIGYFPLAIGNKWYYDYIHYVSYLGGNTTISKKQSIWEVTDTTQMNNGEKYFLVKLFQKRDDNTYKLADTIYIGNSKNNISLLGHFNPLPFSMSFANFNIFNIIDTTNIFKKRLRSFFVYNGNSGDQFHVVTDSIGVTRYNCATLTKGGWGMFLAGCILDGKKYGEVLDNYLVNVIDKSSSIPSGFSLSQNYPNPFNPTTNIEYSIPSAGHVTLKVYDVLGNEIATLVNEYKQPGNYNSMFSALHSSLSSGIYFYRLQCGAFNQIKKCVLLK